VTRWEPSLLDTLRHTGDPEADAAAAAYFAEADASHAGFFHQAVARESIARHPALEAWLSAPAPLPPWADEERLASGASFFALWGLQIGLGLFCCALPMGYAAGPSAHVLDLTARLETDAQRRVFETAQMVLDVTSPGALQPGGQGHATVRRVRLMHAGIRQLVQHDPRVAVTCTPTPGSPYWCPDWGVPVSQEHLLGALIAFGVSMVEALDHLGIEYDEGDAEDYLHLWSVVGYLLGIHADLLPLDRASAATLEGVLRGRNLEGTDGGRRLTGALLELLQGLGPSVVLRGLPAAMMRRLCGTEVADALAVPRPRVETLIVEGLRPLLRLSALLSAHDRLVALLSRRFSRAVMVEFVQAERHGPRPGFVIPDHLAEAWNLPKTPPKTPQPRGLLR
jgi:hypothetical protein